MDLDFIGGTLWLELQDPRPLIHGANTLICLVSHGNSSASRLETVSEEGGMVITSSRTGTGEAGRLRIDPKPLVVVEIQSEQDAVQICVRKGRVLPTADQLMKHNATHLPFRDWCVPCIEGKAPDWPHSQITHSSTAVPMCQLDYFFLNRRGDRDILTGLNFLHYYSLRQKTSKPRCASGCDIHGFLGTQEDLFANRRRTCLGCFSASNQDCWKRRHRLLETTPRYSSSSFGTVERSIAVLKVQFRRMRIALEKSADKSFGIEHTHPRLALPTCGLAGSSRDFTCGLMDSLPTRKENPTVESWQSSESRSS